MFSFFIKKDTQCVEYWCNEDVLTLELTNRLAHVLGFGYKTVLSGNKLMAARKKPIPIKEKLTKENYLRYMPTGIQKKVKRIYLKHFGNDFDRKEKSF